MEASKVTQIMMMTDSNNSNKKAMEVVANKRNSSGGVVVKKSNICNGCDDNALTINHKNDEDNCDVNDTLNRSIETTITTATSSSSESSSSSSASICVSTAVEGDGNEREDNQSHFLTGNPPTKTNGNGTSVTIVDQFETNTTIEVFENDCDINFDDHSEGECVTDTTTLVGMAQHNPLQKLGDEEEFYVAVVGGSRRSNNMPLRWEEEILDAYDDSIIDDDINDSSFQKCYYDINKLCCQNDELYHYNCRPKANPLFILFYWTGQHMFKHKFRVT